MLIAPQEGHFRSRVVPGQEWPGSLSLCPPPRVGLRPERRQTGAHTVESESARVSRWSGFATTLISVIFMFDSKFLQSSREEAGKS